MTRITNFKKSILIMLPFLVFLSGCGSDNSLFTDAGTDVIIEAQKEDYLDISALDEDTGGTQNYGDYEVYTLAYGDFQTKTMGYPAKAAVMETTVVKAEHDSGTMRLIQLMIKRNDFVQKGDIIATVSMETNELDLEELQLRLTRVQERYQQAKLDFEEEHAEAKENISVYRLPGKIDRIEYYQAELDFARQEDNYLNQIEDYEEQIEELKELMNTTEIVAPVDGYVTELTSKMSGAKLEKGDMIAKIIPANQIYISFEDAVSQYAYGNEVTLLMGRNLGTREIPVQVISSTGKALGSDWDRQISYLAESISSDEIMRYGSFYVSASTNAMKNVLLIPKEGVTIEDEKYFVTILHEDGALEKKQFLPGGNNNEHYWVYDGLEEGTSILVYND